MKALLLSFLAVFSVLSAPAEQLGQTVDRLVRSIRAELPQGWSIRYEKEHSWLEISRDEPVASVSAVPNAPANEEPERREFAFGFRVVAAVQPAEYRRLRGENANVQKELSGLYDELVRRRVSRKFDSFQPHTEKDKAAVSRYEALKKSLHKLPDFHFSAIGLEWGSNSPENPTISITDERIRNECERIQEKVISLLSRYEEA